MCNPNNGRDYGSAGWASLFDVPKHTGWILRGSAKFLRISAAMQTKRRLSLHTGNLQFRPITATDTLRLTVIQCQPIWQMSVVNCLSTGHYPRLDFRHRVRPDRLPCSGNFQIPKISRYRSDASVLKPQTTINHPATPPRRAAHGTRYRRCSLTT